MRHVQEKIKSHLDSVLLFTSDGWVHELELQLINSIGSELPIGCFREELFLMCTVLSILERDQTQKFSLINTENIDQLGLSIVQSIGMVGLTIGEFRECFFCAYWFVRSEKHNVIPPESAAKTLDEVLSMNGSINIYMYHGKRYLLLCWPNDNYKGGTNFGFNNGANYDESNRVIQPTVTS